MAEVFQSTRKFRAKPRRSFEFVLFFSVIFMLAIPKISEIFHTSGQNARKMGPRRPLELSEGPPGAFSQRRSSRLDERGRHFDILVRNGHVKFKKLVLESSP